VLKNLSGDWLSILPGDCITKNISIGGINISLRVIELRKKNGFYLAIYKRVERKLLCLQIYLETGRQSNREIALQNIFQSGHKHLAPGNRVAEKEWFLFNYLQKS
jgi:hypothetical protein